MEPETGMPEPKEAEPKQLSCATERGIEVVVGETL